jgi:amino-acid N-acetyltransferase
MIRKARMVDVKAIQKLVADYARKGDMLPRSLSEIYENLRDYFVCIGDGGRVVGSAAIHIMWEDLAEVRSLAVLEGEMGRGVGTRLVEACISEAIVLGITQKIWTDCLKCSKFPDCDEVALVSDLSGMQRA